MLSAGSQYEFIQLTRDLDGPGTLAAGSFDYQFAFKNVDLDVNSYCGIALDVRYEVVATMVYQGSMMNYTAQDTQIFKVRNSTLTEEEKNKESTAVMEPEMQIEFQGFRGREKPCSVELYLQRTSFNIDKDIIVGHINMKELAIEIQSRIKYAKL